MNQGNEDLIRVISEDESLRLKPYVDCCSQSWKRCVCKKKGDLTIGYGRNIEKNGISKAEAEIMRKNDLDWALEESECFEWYSGLNEARKIVIVSMLFNLGKVKFLTFKKMIAALEKRDYEIAASEMLLSLWASQVKKRAVRLSETMKTGRML